jgi:hypothetical protein
MPPSDSPLPALPKTVSVLPLPVEQLYRHADVTALHFTTTADIEPVDGLVGQRRALNTVHFGAQIESSSFNLFVIGSPAAGMRRAVEAVLKDTRVVVTRTDLAAGHADRQSTARARSSSGTVALRGGNVSAGDAEVL